MLIGVDHKPKRYYDPAKEEVVSSDDFISSKKHVHDVHNLVTKEFDQRLFIRTGTDVP